MKKYFLLFSFIISLVFYPMHAQDTVYKLEKGKNYKYLHEIKTEISQEMPGQTMTFTADGTITNVLSVLDILSNGNFQCKLTIEDAIIMVESSQGTQTMGKDLVGVAMNLEIDPYGKITQKDSVPKGVNPQSMQLLSRAQNMLPSLSGMKGKTLQVGENWTDERTDTVSINGMLVTESKTKYTIKEKTKVSDYECFKIEMEGTMDMSGTMSQGGNDLSISGSGTLKGTSFFAPKEGMFIQGTSETMTDQTITLLSDASMRIPVTMHATMKIELVK